MNRNFRADGPDELCVADITHVRPKTGWLYVAVVVDAWSRLVVGWAMKTHLRAELMTLAVRSRPVIFNSNAAIDDREINRPPKSGQF